MTSSNLKLRAARVSIATAASLAVLKLLTGLATGSMAVVASGIDSLLDILMSGVNYLAIRQAEQPADECHPFGHGKYETLATLIQALVITLSGSWIVFEAVRRLAEKSAPSSVHQGMAVLALSVAASFLIARYLRKTADRTDSSALRADALHFSMDVYTNLALLAGLFAVKHFQAPWLDPLMSILVALYILFEAFRLVRHSMRDVLDAELPQPLRSKIEALIEGYHGEVIGYHNLRTRRAGSQKIMDFHLTVCRHLSVAEAHEITDRLEDHIQKEILGSNVTIHIEPCQREECPGPQVCYGDDRKSDRE